MRESIAAILFTEGVTFWLLCGKMRVTNSDGQSTKIVVLDEEFLIEVMAGQR